LGLCGSTFTFGAYPTGSKNLKVRDEQIVNVQAVHVASMARITSS